MEVLAGKEDDMGDNPLSWIGYGVGSALLTIIAGFLLAIGFRLFSWLLPPGRG